MAYKEWLAREYRLSGMTDIEVLWHADRSVRQYGVTTVLSDGQQKLQRVSTNNDSSDPQLIACVSEQQTMPSESHVHQGV